MRSDETIRDLERKVKTGRVHPDTLTLARKRAGVIDFKIGDYVMTPAGWDGYVDEVTSQPGLTDIPMLVVIPFGWVVTPTGRMLHPENYSERFFAEDCVKTK